MKTLLSALALACAACGASDAPQATANDRAQPLRAPALPYAWYAFDLRDHGQVTVMNLLLADTPDLCARFAERAQHAHARLTLWPHGPRVPNGGKVPSTVVRPGRYPVQAQPEDAGSLAGTLHDGAGSSQTVTAGAVVMEVVEPEARDIRGSFEVHGAGDPPLAQQGTMQLRYCAVANTPLS